MFTPFQQTPQVRTVENEHKAKGSAENYATAEFAVFAEETGQGCAHWFYQHGAICLPSAAPSRLEWYIK